MASNSDHQKHLLKNLINNLKKKDLSGFKLAISISESVFFIDPKDIIRLEGEGNYTKFFSQTASPLIVSKII